MYNVEDARQFLTAEGLNTDAIAPQVQGKFMSAFIGAVKPLQRSAVARRAVAEALGTAFLQLR